MNKEEAYKAAQEAADRTGRIHFAIQFIDWDVTESANPLARDWKAFYPPNKRPRGGICPQTEEPRAIGRLTILNQILNTMDVPQERRLDFHWLVRNLRVKNRDHSQFPEAMRIILEIIREDNQLRHSGR